ncbi:hypothetical protein B0T17DRAFT_526657 [Bombardia bombarda]|uniref:Uncharacterized protein n=1 Tax=Bombardia bombarda TaxID=252184 RepID=A0AA40C9T4_9PEZI|nr:hypothetical protein B0T17DRAFT_526657 [Bombardia bombarda]
MIGENGLGQTGKLGARRRQMEAPEKKVYLDARTGERRWANDGRTWSYTDCCTVRLFNSKLVAAFSPSQ